MIVPNDLLFFASGQHFVKASILFNVFDFQEKKKTTFVQIRNTGE